MAWEHELAMENALQSGFSLDTAYRLEPLGGYTSYQDKLAQEVPIAFEYNGIAHAVVLASPIYIKELALGFSYTEGIIKKTSDIYDIEITEASNAYVVQLTIASARINQLRQRRRSLAGRTGCGLCGLETLGEVERKLPALMPKPGFLSPQAVIQATDAMRQAQFLHAETGATHAAGWAGLDGQLVYVFEDVGRHNALDKLIGYLLCKEIATNQGFIVISSRASFEMVQKTVAAGVSALVAVSAPTTYAIALAKRYNMALLGFARGQTFNIYTHSEFLYGFTV